MPQTTSVMTADMVHDLHYHVIKGKCWVVNLNLDFACPEVGDDGINVDTYVIANDKHHARYIASTLYPDATIVGEQNITDEQYVARRS